MPTSRPRRGTGSSTDFDVSSDDALHAEEQTSAPFVDASRFRERIRRLQAQQISWTPRTALDAESVDMEESNMASLLGVALKKEDLLLSPAEELPLPREYLGIEVELEQWNPRPQSQPWWSATSDGSLRNNGIEYVFRQPLFGRDIVSAVNWLWDRVEERNCSSRCGIHVHLNVTDLSCEQLTKLLALYALIEKPLFNFVGHGRDKSNFCLPWYTAGGHLAQYVQYASRIQELKHDKKARRRDIQLAARLLADMPRYSALNLASLPKFGTIEFRQLETTPDRERVFDWLHIVLGLKYAACGSLPNEGWLRLFSEHRARGFLQEFFPARAADVLINSSDSLDEDMWPMLPTAQQLLCYSQEPTEEFTGMDAWATTPTTNRAELSEFVARVRESY